MATETMNTVIPVGTGDPNFEKEMMKFYQNKGGFQGGFSGAGGMTHNPFGGQFGKGQTGTTGYINDMYDASLESQKQQLKGNYETDVSNLDAEKEKSAREHEEDLSRAYVEAYKNAKNFSELQNAYGLTSGAMGQARLAQGNQMQANMTELRAAQEQIDAEIERQRSILAKEYTAAIAKAQADNDFQRAQALYEQAQKEEERMLQMKMAAGELMAGVGDYSILQQLYGLSNSQVQALKDYYFPESSGGGYDYSPGKPDDDDDDEIDAKAVIEAGKKVYEATKTANPVSAESFNATVKTKYGTM